MRRTATIIVGGVVILTVLAFGFFLVRTLIEKNFQTEAQTTSSGAIGKKQLWHCGMHPQVIQDHPGDCPICHMALTPFEPAMRATVSASAATDIRIDPRVVQNMGVRTAQVKKGTLTQTVRAVGMVSLPEPGLKDVSLKVNGWIEKLYVNQEGMHVHQGDPLFEVYSPELQLAAQDLITSAKQSPNLIESIKRRLQLWDVSDEEIATILKSDAPPRTVLFRSPASGHIEEKMIVEGSAVQKGMKLLQIADHSTMWLILDIYSDSIPLVATGQELTATVTGIPAKTFAGTITFIYPHVDHMTRTLKVRATLDNPNFDLKPGMYASAELRTKPIDDVILCPREAVIDSGSKQLVFVDEGNGHFSARKVQVGQSGDDGNVAIVAGLAAGDLVVTSGQFLMDVESRTTEAVMKLADNAANNLSDMHAGPSTTEDKQ